MVPEWLERTELLIGKEALEKLNNTHVLIVGLGGVGSYAAEYIARSGVGKMTIVDGDIVDPTNKNRQLVALNSTVGKNKAEVMSERIKDIAPHVELITLTAFQNPDDTIKLIEEHKYDYVMDCIDSVSPKLYLIKAALDAGCKIISSMGAGAKTDTLKVTIADISETNTCPFAHYVRKRLRRLGVRTGLPTVFSPEPADPKSLRYTDGRNYKRSFYGTISYMPSLFGLHAAAWVIRDIIDKK